MSLDAFDDGYTFEFSYDDPFGRIGKNSGKFRPLNYVQREMIAGEIEKAKADPKKAAEIVCRTVATQVKEWGLTLNGKPLAINAANCCNLVHPAHIDALYLIIIGARPAMPPITNTEAPLAGDPLDGILGESPSVDALQKN